MTVAETMMVVVTMMEKMRCRLVVAWVSCPLVVDATPGERSDAALPNPPPTNED
jgi:hypothetical protein